MKTRQEREKELAALMRTDAGMNKIVEQYMAASGQGLSIGPVGLPVSEMAKKLLDLEYPEADTP